MIVKNEENTLARCLDSCCAAVDEVVIVDTGSADNTKQIAARYTDKIYDFEWCDDFSAARNYAYDKAEMDYILWLDADDILLPGDLEQLLELKRDFPADVDTVMLKYNVSFDEKGAPTFSYHRERLTRRSLGFRWFEPVHEYLAFGGKVMRSDIAVTHAKPTDAQPITPNLRNLNIYESMIRQGRELSPRGMYYYARELKDHGRYRDAIEYFERFLNTNQGWIEDCICACGEMGRCHTALDEHDRALKAMIRSFLYDTPRSDICCQIGYHYMNKRDYDRAISWFETAITVKQPEHSWGFAQHDNRGFVPCLECAVCYDRLGNMKKAEEYNELASLFKPDSEKIAYNRRYFRQKKEEALRDEREAADRESAAKMKSSDLATSVTGERSSRDHGDTEHAD